MNRQERSQNDVFELELSAFERLQKSLIEALEKSDERRNENKKLVYNDLLLFRIRQKIHANQLSTKRSFPKIPPKPSVESYFKECIESPRSRENEGFRCKACDMVEESTHTTSSVYSIDSIDDSIHITRARKLGASRRSNTKPMGIVDFSTDIQVPLADESDANNRKRWVLQRQANELRNGDDIEDIDLSHNIDETVDSSISEAHIMDLPYCFDSTHDSMHMTKTRLPTLGESSVIFRVSGGSSCGSSVEKQEEQFYPAPSKKHDNNLSDNVSVNFSDDESFADPSEFETQEDYQAVPNDLCNNRLNSGLMLTNDKNVTFKTVSAAEVSLSTNRQLEMLANSSRFKLTRSGRAERDLFKSFQSIDVKEDR